mmetsp:Transcript_2405/g.7183  ORF Transcript_2405/g.7183 Transcript_2405/m.7183 type:complete len:100 (+) Transcript_2405:117-416(+)
MKVKKEISIDAPTSNVWKVLGDDYASAGQWGSGVYISTARTDVEKVVKAAPVAGRTCETSLGPVSEVITRYEPTTGDLAYRANASAMPFFVKGKQLNAT